MILVGGLDGQVTQCHVGGACKLLIQLEGSAIAMKLNRSRQVRMYSGFFSRGKLEGHICPPPPPWIWFVPLGILNSNPPPKICSPGNVLTLDQRY